MKDCSKCSGVVMYRSFQRTDPAWSSNGTYTENPTFWIYRGDEAAEWDRDGRALFGDAGLVEEIRSRLSGESELVLIPGFLLIGFWLLMSEHEPYAVHWVAQSIEGCTFSETAPDWGNWNKPNGIY